MCTRAAVSWSLAPDSLPFGHMKADQRPHYLGGCRRGESKWRQARLPRHLAASHARRVRLSPGSVCLWTPRDRCTIIPVLPSSPRFLEATGATPSVPGLCPTAVHGRHRRWSGRGTSASGVQLWSGAGETVTAVREDHWSRASARNGRHAGGAS